MALDKSLKKVAWILPLVILAGSITVYASSASLRGKITVWMWSGKKTLRCDGGDVLVIKGKTAHTANQVIYASGRCRVKIIDSELSGSIAVYANQNARVTIINSRLTGTSHGLYLGNGSRATVKGSTITSKGSGIYVGTGAELTLVGGAIQGKSGIYVGTDSRIKVSGTKLAVKDRAFYVGTRARLTVKRCKVTGAKNGVYVGNKGWLRLSKTDLHVTGRPMYISNDTDVEISDSKLKGGSDGLYISNRAKVRLRNVDLRANQGALYVSTSAKVVFDGGRIISAGRAIYASNNANITLRKVKVVGSIHKSKGAVINRVGGGVSADVASKRADALAKRLKRYKSTACWGVLSCYQQNRQFGKVDVQVQAHISDEGKATKTRVHLYRKAKAKVRRCLQRNVKKKRIKDFTGPVGLLHCRVIGNIQDGVQRIRYTTEYRVDPMALKQVKSGDLPDVK